VLKQNPTLPQGRSETEGGAKWFTLGEVLRLRAHFGNEGGATATTLPYRPKDLPAKIIAVANFKRRGWQDHNMRTSGYVCCAGWLPGAGDRP
jgi:hypothetical protein